jgi:hypothetical protein
MEIVYERVAAIDVGKKIIAVAVRTPGPAFRVIRPSWRCWMAECPGQGQAGAWRTENRLEKRISVSAHLIAEWMRYGLERCM